jgi:hypothetical protein
MIWWGMNPSLHHAHQVKANIKPEAEAVGLIEQSPTD